MKRLLSLMLAAMLLFALAAVPTVAEESDTTGAISPDTAWYSADKTEFELRTAAQMLGFLQLAQNNDFAGKTVRLTEDIDLNPGATVGLTQLDESHYAFPTKPANVWTKIPVWKGTLDGGGHVLRGIYLQENLESGGKLALFTRFEQGGTLKNLIIENSIVLAGTASGGDSLPKDCQIAGIVHTMNGSGQYMTLENLWLDLDVVYKGWSQEMLSGVAFYIENNVAAMKNIVYAGNIGGIKPDGTLSTTPGARITQLLYNMNWKSATSLDNIALLGTALPKTVTNDGNTVQIETGPVVENDKMSGAGNVHIVWGKYDSTEAAKAAGKFYDYQSSQDWLAKTNADFTYSVFAGGVIPTAVSGMLSANAIRVVGVQRSDATYTAGEGDGAYTAQSLRFVAAIRLTGEQLGAFEKAGFLIQIKENGTDSYLIREGTTVYTSITANNVTVTAGEYGADYLVALSVKNVPVGSEIELVITPYLTDAGATKWAGTPVSAKVLASGAFDSEN